MFGLSLPESRISNNKAYLLHFDETKTRLKIQFKIPINILIYRYDGLNALEGPQIKTDAYLQKWNFEIFELSEQDVLKAVFSQFLDTKTFESENAFD